MINKTITIKRRFRVPEHVMDTMVAISDAENISLELVFTYYLSGFANIESLFPAVGAMEFITDAQDTLCAYGGEEIISVTFPSPNIIIVRAILDRNALINALEV